ncbi:MAG TPA: peptidylprolyl isomerase [Balneolales bacterium]|nr:peptidylprolyl isomerase [Balneolales bacterium]
MSKVNQGDTVKVHYTGKLDDESVFDSSKDREPIKFTLGQGQLIPGFEDAVLGMEPGDEKTVKIPVDKAYGPRRDDMLVTVNKSEFPENVDPEVGQSLQVSQADGKAFNVVVSDISEEEVTLDANHPLAGKELYFDIQLIEIV